MTLEQVPRFRVIGCKNLHNDSHWKLLTKMRVESDRSLCQSTSSANTNLLDSRTIASSHREARSLLAVAECQLAIAFVAHR